MKKSLAGIVCLLSAVCFAELAVPQGAVVFSQVTVTQEVAIVKIEASEIRWQLPTAANGLKAPRCIVTKAYTDASGKVTVRPKAIPLSKVATYLENSGSSLSNIVAILANAVQMETDEEFAGQ